MMYITPNLRLDTYNTSIDASSVLVYNYVSQVSGSSINENLGIIDEYAGNTNEFLNETSGSIFTSASRLENTKSAVIQIIQPSVDVEIISGSFCFLCPLELDGYNLFRAQAFLNVSSPDGDYQIKVYNITTSASMLSTPIVIPSGNEIGTVGVVDTSYDDVSTNDILLIYVSTEPTTKGTGLQVILEFAAP